MRTRVVFLALALLSLAGVLAAQNSSAPARPGRKVMLRTAPTYPELAKRMHVQGAVKIEATVRPNGTVKSTRVIGGSPVLVGAAVDAVSRWKFEAAQTESLEIVQVNFDDQ
ncbi:MAG TPA: energy transducer TonB [Candidatus Acidoferrales bacterium]|jgi:protein TonB|nr:energy transducer TonB [Candidatus Acidoferrales bacterium]